MEYRQSIANPISVATRVRRENYGIPGQPPGTLVYTTKIARSGNLIRFDREEGGGLSRWTVYDGSKVVINNGHFQVGPDGKRPEMMVSLDPSQLKSFPSPFDSSGENHWLATMKDCLTRPSDVDGESEIIDGQTLLLRLSVRLADGETWANRAWLDIEHDYLPERIEIDTNSDGKVETVRTIEETIDCSGIRFPALSRLTSRTTKGSRIFEEVHELESCSLSREDVPDSLFAVDLSGNIVLQDLDHGSTLVDREEVDAYLAQISKRFWATRTFWIAIVNILLMTLVAWRIRIGRT